MYGIEERTPTYIFQQTHPYHANMKTIERLSPSSLPPTKHRATQGNAREESKVRGSSVSDLTYSRHTSASLSLSPPVYQHRN